MKDRAGELWSWISGPSVYLVVKTSNFTYYRKHIIIASNPYDVRSIEEYNDYPWNEDDRLE